MNASNIKHHRSSLPLPGSALILLLLSFTSAAFADWATYFRYSADRENHLSRRLPAGA
ncbi:hypothetical protein [Endothiovibrio diazotrophicus]